MLDTAATLKGYVEEFMKWVKEHPTATKWIAGFALALGTLGPILGPIGGKITDVFLRKMFGAGNASEKALGQISKSMDNMAKNAGNMGRVSAKNLTIVNKGMSRSGEIANSGAAKMIGFGLAMIMVGYGIKMASEGLAKLVAAFKDLNPQQQAAAIKALLIVMGGFVGIMLIIALLGAPTLPILIGIGLAMIGIGFGMKLAFDAMAKFVTALKDIGAIGERVFMGVFKEMKEIIKMVIDAALGLLKMIIDLGKNATNEQIQRIARLAFAVGQLAVALAGGAIVGAIGNWMGGKTAGQLLIEFNQSLAALQADKIEKFGAMVHNLLQILQNPNFETAMKTLTEGIQKITKALNEMPEERKVSLETLNNSLNIIKTITADNVAPTIQAVTLIKDAKPTEQFVQVIEHFHKIHGESKESKENFLLEGIKEVGSLLKEKFSSDGEKKIQLVVSGKDLSNALNSYGDHTINGVVHGLSQG